MCLVTPGAAMIGSIMLWDETPLHRLSWLAPNCRAIHLLFNTVCLLQESNGKKNTVGMCYLFVLSPFKCTKVKQVQLTVPVIVNWSAHLSVNPSFFKPDFFSLALQSRESHPLGSNSVWFSKIRRDKTNPASNPSLYRPAALLHTQIGKVTLMRETPTVNHWLSGLLHFHLRAPLSSLINISQKVVGQ